MGKANFLKYFKEDYLSEIYNQTRSSDALDVYYKSDAFKFRDDQVVVSQISLEGDYPELQVDVKKLTKHEVDNAIKLYEYFRFDEVTASDARVWTYLTHSRYFRYVQLRFPDPGEKVAENIRFHWFVKTVRRNALAGLWWAVHQTKSPWDLDPLLKKYDNGDPYRFTRVLLSNQDLFFHLMERNLGKNPRLLAYFLIEVESRKAKGIGAVVKKQAPYLTLVSNYRVLSSLSGGELTKVMQGLFK